MLQVATTVKKTSKIAKKLQNAQFKTWLDKAYKPSGMVHRVFKMDSQTWNNSPSSRLLIRRAYYEYLEGFLLKKHQLLEHRYQH